MVLRDVYLQLHTLFYGPNIATRIDFLVCNWYETMTHLFSKMLLPWLKFVNPVCAIYWYEKAYTVSHNLILIYSTITVMTSLVALSFYGASQIKFHWVERYDKLLVGSVLGLVGLLTLIFHHHDGGEVSSGGHLHRKIIVLWRFLFTQCIVLALRSRLTFDNFLSPWLAM